MLVPEYALHPHSALQRQQSCTPQRRWHTRCDGGVRRHRRSCRPSRPSQGCQGRCAGRGYCCPAARLSAAAAAAGPSLRIRQGNSRRPRCPPSAPLHPVTAPRTGSSVPRSRPSRWVAAGPRPRRVRPAANRGKRCGQRGKPSVAIVYWWGRGQLQQDVEPGAVAPLSPDGKPCRCGVRRDQVSWKASPLVSSPRSHSAAPVEPHGGVQYRW